MPNSNFFLNSDSEEKLNEFGYAEIQLLNKQEIAELLFFYYRETKQKDKDNLATFLSASKDYKIKVNQKINSVLYPLLKTKVTKAYKSFFGNFMTKENNCPPLMLHADWSYVDESENRAFNIWIPLVEAKIQNGGLWIVPKSHKIVKFLRGVNLPRSYYSHLSLLQTKYAIPVKVKPGHAIVYDTRLLHFSYSNYTKKKRLAVSLFMLPTETPYYYHYMNSSNTLINRYKLDSIEDLLEQKYDSIPTKLTLLDQLNPKTFKPISVQEIGQKLKKVSLLEQLRNSIVYNKSLMERKH